MIGNLERVERGVAQVKSEPEGVAVEAWQVGTSLPRDYVAKIITRKRVAVVCGIALDCVAPSVKHLSPQPPVGARSVRVKDRLWSASIYDETVAV